MRILVATGGSAHSTRALRLAAQLAAQARVPLTVLTIIKQTDQEPEAESILIGAKALIESMIPSQELELKTRVGHPAEEILSELEEGHYAVAVLGEKQHHGLITRFVIGSTAQRVVEYAPCPVILAKGRIPGAVERVLICDAGVPNDSVVDRVREQFPLLLHIVDKVTVLHVKGDERHDDEQEGSLQIIHHDTAEGRLIAHDLRRLGDEGVPCSPRLRHGDVVEQILAEVQCRDYQLVVIGASRSSSWRRILLDDVANRLMVKMEHPMLVVH